ncbi:MAG TPA: HAD-IIA family hydrolase [Tepidisphaeraceae bacterium]|jgi:NagD protein|nr:HAD-IIA family hydrolase [Tepidisphaeraceae bacterium]
MSRLSSIKHVALDLDGTLYLGGRLFTWTPGFLQALRELGIGRTFFTNNSSKSTKKYVETLNKLGVDATAEEIYSSTHSTFDYLREELPGVKKVYVLGTPGLREEFGENGFEVVGEEHDENPDAVVVGYDTTLEYEHVCRAAWWISKGLPFVATHPDRVCPTDKPTLMVDCAAMCAMLSVATGRELTAVLGKPDPRMLAGVMKRQPGLKVEEIGVVGDRLYTDMAMAYGAGAMGILVLSGEATLGDVERAERRPDLIVEHVGVLGEMLAKGPRAKALGLAESCI